MNEQETSEPHYPIVQGLHLATHPAVREAWYHFIRAILHAADTIDQRQATQQEATDQNNVETKHA